MGRIEFNNIEFGLNQFANIINSKILDTMLKPKDSRFESVDDVLKYAVENYSRLDEIFKFVSDQLGLYLEFDKKSLVEMISSTYDDVRSKMVNIQLFETIPFWWVVFPNKERLIEFLKTKIYFIVSDMSKDMSEISEETGEGEVFNYTLPHIVSSIRSGLSTLPTDNPEQLLNLIERTLYGKYLDTNMNLSQIKPHIDAQTPITNITSDMMKDFAQTIMNEPELNDSLLKLGELMKNVSRQIKNTSSPSLQELNKHLKNVTKNINEHFKLLSKMKKNGVNPDDGFKMYENMIELMNELDSIEKLLENIQEVAPRIKQQIIKQLTPELKQLFNALNTQLHNYSIQQNNNPNQQIKALTNQIQQNENTTNYKILIKQLKDIANKLNKLSLSEIELIRANVISMIKEIENKNPPKEVLKILESIKQTINYGGGEQNE